MANVALVDNDVVLKVCAYGAGETAVELIERASLVAQTLPSAAYVIADAVKRSKSLKDKVAIQHRLSVFLGRSVAIEPNDREIGRAAAIEEHAQQIGLSLDVGEAQLLAMLESRCCSLMLTGDKRAVRATARISSSPSLHGRLVCLEQLALCLLNELDCADLRARVCGAPEIDKALSNCFACHSQHVQASDVESGLLSYINDLRADAPNLLAADSRLGAIS